MHTVATENEATVGGQLDHISDLTSAKIRTFLFEVAEGVSNYRSLHSLTQQVEHQYHGRFLIELLQNAHDAFAGSPGPGQLNRIEIVLDSEDSEHGSLLVANDGEPFTSSNFERLSQLGQSDKDPQKSIGNKGIGFRSVLEVSERPEVYSRASRLSGRFDGYCFSFRPEVVQSLVEPMMTLASECPIPISPVSDSPIVDWSEDLLRKFRRRVRANGVQWLTGECKYLSPYLLPVPLREIQSSAVRTFEAQGFATVVRLPLKSAEAERPGSAPSGADLLLNSSLSGQGEQPDTPCAGREGAGLRTIVVGSGGRFRRGAGDHPRQYQRLAPVRHLESRTARGKRFAGVSSRCKCTSRSLAGNQGHLSVYRGQARGCS